MSKTWKTKGGDVIKYSDLTDSHLLNILHMLGPGLIGGCAPCGEDIWCDTDPEYEDLLSEAESRGIL